MDARMVYRTLPSLEHAALLKTVTTLWNQDDIKTSLVNLNYPDIFDFDQREWMEMEDRVTGKALELPLPKSLKESVLGLIKPIGRRIFKWMKDHNDTYMRITVPTEFSWTAQGTVDEKRTAECLIKDKNLDILTLYKLACINCLEDDVRELWKEIPESDKSTLCKDKESLSEVTGYKLVVFWTYAIKGKVDNLNIIVFKNSRGAPYQCAFEYAALNGYIAATKYFWQKLTSVERAKCLVKVAAGAATRVCYAVYRSSKNYADILCFLLSQMSEEQQVEVFIKCPHYVLCFLLDWPWQEFFMETAKRLYNFLSVYGFDVVLTEIVHEVVVGHKDYNYQSLLGEFWQQSLTDHKKYIIGQCENGYLLSHLLRIKDGENIKLILKDASTLKGEDFIFSDGGRGICEKLIQEGENDLLKFFLRQCMSSKNILIESKKKLRERIKGTARVTRSMYMKSFEERRIERENKLCIKLLEVLVDLIRKYDKKRPAEKGNRNPPKKLCI